MIKGLEIEIAQYSSAEAQASLSKEDVAAQAQYLAVEKNLISKIREAKQPESRHLHGPDECHEGCQP